MIGHESRHEPKPASDAKVTTGAMMKALVYQGLSKKALEDRPKP